MVYTEKIRYQILYFALLCFAVTSPSPGSSTDVRFGYKGPFAEQDDGHKNVSKYVEFCCL